MSHQKNTQSKKYGLFVFLGFLIISFIFSHKLLLTKGLIGLRDDWLMVPFSSQHQFSATRFLYSWFGGGAFYRNLGEIPGIILGTLSYLFKFNGELYSKFFVWFFPALAGFTFYQLSVKLKLKFWPAILSGFIYMSSPFFYNSIVSGYILFLIALALLPVVLRLYINILESEKVSISQIIYLSLVIRLAITQDNVVYIAGIIIITYFLFHVLINRQVGVLRSAITRSLFVLLFIIIFTAQFLVLIPLDLKESIAFVSSGLDTWITDLSPKIVPAIFQDGGGYHYYLSSIPKAFTKLWFIVSSTFIALLAASVLFSKKNKYILYFSILFIVGTLGFKGANPPFGSVNRFLYQNIPVFMGGFRNSQYFTPISIMGQSFCFAAFINYAYQYLSHRKKHLGVILVTLVIVIRALPFFTGNYTNSVQNVPIGQDLLQMDAALRSKHDQNTVLMLPPIVPITYKDSKFAGLDVMTYGQPHKFIGIAGDSPFQRQLIEHLYLSDNKDLFRWFMSIYNVEHIAWRNDFKSDTITFMSPDYIKYRPIWTNERLYDNVISLPEVSLGQRFSSQTALYQYSKPSPIIYSPTKVVIIDKNPLKPLEYQDLVPQNKLSTTIFPKQNNQDILKKLSSLKVDDSTLVESTQINPTKYEVQVKSSKKPFILVFSKNYNNLWQIVAKNNKKIDGITHFKTNGYANAWIIDPKSICEKVSCQSNGDQSSFNLTISFSAQKYYFPAIILAYGSLLLASILLLTNKLVSRKNNQ